MLVVAGTEGRQELVRAIARASSRELPGRGAGAADWPAWSYRGELSIPLFAVGDAGAEPLDGGGDDNCVLEIYDSRAHSTGKTAVLDEC
jgi:hypothetical protein